MTTAVLDANTAAKTAQTRTVAGKKDKTIYSEELFNEELLYFILK